MNPEIETLNFHDSSWQIMRKEFVSAKNLITITFQPDKGGKIQISEAALKALGNPMYGQVLVNPKTHHLMLMGTNTKTASCISLRPRFGKGDISFASCESLVNRIWDLMNWSPDCGYISFGHLTKTDPATNGPVLVFNLDTHSMFINAKTKGAKQRERKRILPTDRTERLGLGIRSAELLPAENNVVL